MDISAPGLRLSASRSRSRWKVLCASEVEMAAKQALASVQQVLVYVKRAIARRTGNVASILHVGF